jgi:hypothetical protein
MSNYDSKAVIKFNPGDTPCDAGFPARDFLPITAIPRDDGDFHGPLPASFSQTPTPIALPLKTNAKPQFDRTVDRAVEVFFLVFQGSNLAECWLSC